MHMRHTSLRLAAFAILSVVVVGCLPATNPWDPDTDPALQVPGTIRGTLSYPDRSNAGGIAVELATLPALPAVASTTTNEATNGSFALEVQPGTYWVRASATGYEELLVGPFTLRAGERLDIGRQTLAFAPANSAIGGAVTTGETLPERGIKVTAAPLVGGGSCGAPAGEAVTDEDGAYLIDGLRPGTYVVVAFVEGATVALSPPVTIVENGVGNVDLAIRNGSDALLLRDPVTGSEEFTRESSVRVIVDDTFSWATEMTLSEDPTFAQGSGWQTFTTDSSFQLSSALAGLPRTVVYAKFRSPCATSPLYSDDIIYDDIAPVILSARLEGVDGLSYADGLGVDDALPPLVVVPDTRQTLLLAVDAFDITGVRIDVVELDDAGGETPVAVFPDVPSTDSLALVRHAVPIPVEEGLSHFRVLVSDIAGNQKLFERTLDFRILRDLKPPTAPLPAVTDMTVSGDTALVWLTERTCTLGDGTTVLALVCEENPKAQGFFEVRGGPAFVDFTAFDNPPFAVPVFRDGETEIEIRAVDKAGNPSASVGTVRIAHVASRTLLTLAADRIFAGGDAVKLSALGPTAFYEVAQRPGTTTGTRYPTLVAQPADRPNISLEAFTSSTPEVLRRLSWGCAASGSPCNIFPEREAGPLFGGHGALMWLEYSGDLSPAFPTERRARIFRSHPNGSGRHEIASQPNLIGENFIVDEEDAPAQNRETCATRGKMDCATLDAWAGLTQAAPDHLIVTPRELAVSGTATIDVPIGQGLSPPSTQVVNGPALIAMQVSARASARLFGFSYELDVSSDQVLRTAAFRRYVANGPWNASPTSPTVDSARLGVITTGQGIETFVLADDFQDSSQQNFSMLVGVLVPAGMTVTFATRPAPVDDLVYSSSDPYKVDGLVVRSLTDAQPDSFTSAEIAASLNVNEHIVGTLHIQDTDFLGTGLVAGVTRVALDDDGTLTSVTAPANTLVPGESARHETIVRTPRTSSQVHISDVSQAALERPASCVALVEVDEEVTLRDLAMEGRGMLDDFYIHAFKSTTPGAAGLYQPAEIFAGVSYIPLDAGEGADNCRANVLQTFSNQVLTGTVEQTVLSSTTVDASGDATSWSGVGPVNTVGPSQVLPMDADTLAWEVYLSEGVPAGDADLYAEHGEDPVPATSDYWSENIGSNEYIHAPNNGTGDLYVGVYGWNELSGFEALGVPLKRVDTVDVPAGATLRVLMTGTGDADLFVAFDGDPTFFTYECASYGFDTSDEACDVTATTATTATIAVAYYGPAVVSLNMSVLESTAPEVIATIPLGGANFYRVTLADPDTADLLVGHDSTPTTSSYDCYAWSDGICEPSGTNEIPVLADEIQIAILPKGTSANYAVTVELTEVGCENAVATRDSLGTYAEGTFTPGIYALTWGRTNSAVSALLWPSSNPQVKRGPRIEGTGAVRFIGAPTQALLDQGNLLVAAASTSAPLCDLALTFDARTVYTRVAIDDERTFAIARFTDVGGASTSRLVIDDGASVGTRAELPTLVDFGADRRPWSLTVHAEKAIWLETNPSGFGPKIRALSVVDGQTAGDECTVVDIAETVAPFEVTAVSSSDGLIVAGGLSATGGVVHVISLMPPDDDHPCHQATIARTMQVDGKPLAVHSDGIDTFIIVEREGADRLLHFDARDVVPLFAGGNLEAIGFDVDDGRVALAISPTYSSGDTHLMFLDGATDLNTMTAVQIARTPSLIHPTLLDGGLVALTRDATNALELRAFPGRAHAGVVIDDAASVLAGAPVPPANDRHLLTRTPMLAADGSTLALLGHAGATRTLVIFDVTLVDAGDDDVTVQAATAFGPLTVPGFPTSLTLDAGVVVITYGDASSVVVKRDGLGVWAVDTAAHGPDERVIGASMGELLVFTDPGPIFVQKPPTVLDAELRSTTGTSSLGFAADGYFHDFAGVETFIDGDILLYDMSAEPGLLWRIDRATGAFMPTDGPHRPLLVGTEGIGASALPRVAGDSVYYIRRTATGNALYRMRL
jgi:hypothetical protein